MPQPQSKNHLRLVDDFPSLVAHLKADGFDLVPNYTRPLSDTRIVAERFDPVTGVQPVTEREYVETIYWRGVGGHRLEQVWRFEVDGCVLQCNDSFVTWTNRGLQYATRCAACPQTIWTNADRSPRPLCRRCRSQSGWCEQTDRTCEAAYKSTVDPCRCDVCRAWNTLKHRRLRAARRARRECNPTVSTSRTREEKAAYPLLLFKTTNGGVTGWEPAWWLPESVRASMARYEGTVEVWDDAASALLEAA